LGISIHNFTQLGGRSDFYKGAASTFVQFSEMVLRRSWQWLDIHSVKKALVVHEKSKFTEAEKGMTGGEQSQEHTHHFDIGGIVQKKFVLAGQTVNSAYYCDVLR
jgi:hypothetical protein